MKTVRAWSVLWREETRREGKREHLMGVPDHPSRTVLFNTRKEARFYINTRFGYIRKRDDLRSEPHGWKMPLAVQVEIEIRPVGVGR